MTAIFHAQTPSIDRLISGGIWVRIQVAMGPDIKYYLSPRSVIW